MVNEIEVGIDPMYRTTCRYRGPDRDQPSCGLTIDRRHVIHGRTVMLSMCEPHAVEWLTRVWSIDPRASGGGTCQGVPGCADQYGLCDPLCETCTGFMLRMRRLTSDQ